VQKKQLSSIELGFAVMDLPKRKKNRLDGFDYSSRGAYFITICVIDRNALLWEQGAEIVRSDQPPLSQYGRIVETAIRQMDRHYGNIVVDTYCIMPDHVHLVVFILPKEPTRADFFNTEHVNTVSAALPTMIGSFKRWVSRQIGFSIWQKSFHDKILLDQDTYLKICRYIAENPLHCENDSFV
jgi:putative transposase